MALNIDTDWLEFDSGWDIPDVVENVVEPMIVEELDGSSKEEVGLVAPDYMEHTVEGLYYDNLYLLGW